MRSDHLLIPVRRVRHDRGLDRSSDIQYSPSDRLVVAPSARLGKAGDPHHL
jgi:hypothetical protein